MISMCKLEAMGYNIIDGCNSVVGGLRMVRRRAAAAIMVSGERHIRSKKYVETKRSSTIFGGKEMSRKIWYDTGVAGDMMSGTICHLHSPSIPRPPARPPATVVMVINSVSVAASNLHHHHHTLTPVT